MLRPTGRAFAPMRAGAVGAAVRHGEGRASGVDGSGMGPGEGGAVHSLKERVLGAKLGDEPIEEASAFENDFATGDSLLNVWTRPENFDVDKFVDAFGNCPPDFLQASLLLLRPVGNRMAQKEVWPAACDWLAKPHGVICSGRTRVLLMPLRASGRNSRMGAPGKPKV